MSRSTQASVSRIEEIVGAEHVRTDAAAAAARQVDHLRPSAVVLPADAQQVAEIVRFAATEKLAIIACGSGSKLGIGAPPEHYDIALDLTRMNRVLAYDPDDLTLGIEPGTPLENLLRALREQRQFLPLAVPFGGRATIGGIVAANSNSPLRHSYGSIRDYCLGMEFVTGEGVISKSGGRVVKNVTGYDLHKLLIGSFGTLAIITRVNFRTFPMPSMERAFVASFSKVEDAMELCRAIAKSTLTPQILEILNPGAGVLLASDGARLDAHQWTALIVAAGQSVVVQRYAKDISRMAEAAHAVSFNILSDEGMSSFLPRACEFPRIVLDSVPEAMIFRISVLPTAILALLSQLRETSERNHLNLATIARASGFLYAAFLPVENGEGSVTNLSKAAAEVFEVCAGPNIEARAMIEWCPADVKRECSVWGHVRPDFELMRRVKSVFDPQRLLSPGRYAGGI